MKTLNDGKTMINMHDLQERKRERGTRKNGETRDCTCEHFTMTEGRLTLSVRIFPLDQDLLVFLLGGDTHVGAVSTATPNGEVSYGYTLPGHKETDIANRQAKRLAAAFQKNVTVVCGIHIDDISKEEICSAIKLCDWAADRIVKKEDDKDEHDD